MSSASLTDVWLPLLRYKAATLDALKNEVDAQELLNLFSAARNDYLCQFIHLFAIHGI